MKKRNLLFTLISLFSISLVACNNNTEQQTTSDLVSSSSSSESKPDNPWWDDDESSSEEKVITLEKDERENYVLNKNITNKDSSMAYEIFVRSFYDTNGDGVGDLNGVTLKLPYLADLGIKTIWLMPINPCTTYHGYDITDYYDINPSLGSLKDFENLIAEAKKLNIDIIMDMVFNHTSKFHPWFEQSYQDFINHNVNSDSKADWYNWRDHNGSGYHGKGDIYYEGQFDQSMPDLNFDSENVLKEVDKIIKFWVEKGVAGFRLDAVKHYYEGVKKSVNVLNYIKETGLKYNPNFFCVGEVFEGPLTIEDYASSKCDSFFKFDSSLAMSSDESIFALIRLLNTGRGFTSSVEATEARLKAKNPDAFYSWFLGNHDTDRTGGYLKKPEDAKMAASVIGLVPGMSYVYYGEEIQMIGTRSTSPEDHSDVRRRLPMVWSEKDKTGECDFPEQNRTDLMDNEQVSLGVDDQLKIPYSITNHYKKVINVRNHYPFLKHGIFTDKYNELNINESKVVAYEIKSSETSEKITVIHNLSNKNIECNVSTLGSVIDNEINTSLQLPTLENGVLKLGKWSTVILK